MLRGYWFVLTTFFFALVLSIMPMPTAIAVGRPEWLVMAVIFWVIMAPQQVGLVTAFLLGLMMDVLEGKLMGTHGFAMTFVTFLTLSLYQRLRMYPSWQQALMVFILIGFYLLIVHWISSIVGQVEQNLIFLLPAVISGLIWPWVYIILRGAKRKFRVG